MRYVFTALVFAAAVVSSAAHAEKRIFIIANNSDGYGVDRDFAQAASFRKIDRDEITGAVPSTNGTSARDEFVAIECSR
jgi:hypothetical protein